MQTWSSSAESSHLSTVQQDQTSEKTHTFTFLGVIKWSAPPITMLGEGILHTNTKQFLAPAGGPTTQLKADLSPWRPCQMPQVPGSVPQDCPHLRFTGQLQVQVVTCASDQTATALQIGGSDTPFPGSINLLECSQSSEKHFTSHVARLLQKDLVEECTGQGMRRGHKILFPWLHMFTNPEALQTQSFWRFMEASLHGSD